MNSYRRTMLVHLNVEVPQGDERTADEIADAVLSALALGKRDQEKTYPPRAVFRTDVRSLAIVCPLAEEV